MLKQIASHMQCLNKSLKKIIAVDTSRECFHSTPTQYIYSHVKCVRVRSPGCLGMCHGGRTQTGRDTVRFDRLVAQMSGKYEGKAALRCRYFHVARTSCRTVSKK